MLAAYEGFSEVDSSTSDQITLDNSDQDEVSEASDKTTKRAVELALLRSSGR